MPMDTALSPPVGRLLGGRYHVGSLLAHGGMATVYLGTDIRLDRVVAIKIAHPEFSDDAEFVRRFIGEARSAARISSPNVVGIYDQGSEGQTHFIVMEYVQGRTLRELMSERGRLSPAQSLDIMFGVLSGLAAAHEAGLAHRDVKPENVLLTSAGVAKVADFGLARSVGGHPQTGAGMIIGTAAYLAPEQVTGAGSDARTDVYAAGVMLFEMLTGVQPHVADTPLAVAYKHVNDAVRLPSSVVPGLSPGLDTLVAMATSRDPDLRPTNAGEFLEAINAARHAQGLAGASGSYPVTPPAPPAAPPAPVPYQTGGWDSGARQAGGAPAVVGASALPSLGPAAHSGQRGGATPGAGRPGGPDSAVNHTLIVPADGGYGPGYQTDYTPGYGGGNRPPVPGRHGGGPPEPWLQRLLFSTRLIYLVAALAGVVLLAVGGWWITSGRYTTVPQVNGLVLNAAQAALTNAGLKPTISSRVHNAVTAGDVISTSPAGGSKVTGGTQIAIVISLGPQLVAVPNVTGQPLAQARQQLSQAGLQPSSATQQAVSNTVPAGSVIDTSPKPFAQVAIGSTVTITVSAGPGLPDFKGKQVSDAQAAAQAGGYQIQQQTEATGTTPAGTIDSQSPAAGTPITSGEVVTVNVSPGPPGAAVPNVTGLSVNKAQSQLQQAGFQVQVSSSGPGSKVCSYSPTGTAPSGSTITLNVGFLNGCM